MDTVAIYDRSTSGFHVINANSHLPGSGADMIFCFGPAGAGWIPLAGDWDGVSSPAPGVAQHAGASMPEVALDWLGDLDPLAPRPGRAKGRTAAQAAVDTVLATAWRQAQAWAARASCLCLTSGTGATPVPKTAQDAPC